ncbi:helix-turn-helix domain-containing protein [Gandjariella thermophila]|uniref:Helix-turn-helix domain-containing protein n=1 Tax=Gandjariella thermophila TaxID=1931992 RepID=A0A4D4J474_9PSEU|nr:helix-turn-helix domain-containing protein [Gandjariella thermophila]GDY28777.1 hypothetical protein GTS_04100 [Gandjariella thermophila]
MTSHHGSSNAYVQPYVPQGGDSVGEVLPFRALAGSPGRNGRTQQGRGVGPRSNISTERLVYKVDEVARMLGLSRGMAYQYVREGVIPAERIGRRWVIPRRRFHAWLDGLSAEGGGF